MSNISHWNRDRSWPLIAKRAGDDRAMSSTVTLAMGVVTPKSHRQELR
jgi:hypothetical protein